MAKEIEAPVICGPFTNWQPKKMITVSEMLTSLSTTNIIGEKFKKLIAVEEQTIGLVRLKSTATALRRHLSVEASEKTNWPNNLVENLGGYKKPVIVNGTYFAKQAHSRFSPEDVFVYIDFVKAGRHFYTVNLEDEFYLHRTIVRNRDEQPVLFNKKKWLNGLPDNFDEDCFRDYQEEFEVIKHFESDKHLWKLSQMVKKPD